MNKKITVNLAVAIAIIAMTVTFSVTMLMSMRVFDKTVSRVREKEIMYNKISEIDKVLRAQYYGEINEEMLRDYLATGYLAGIGDKYASYYTVRQYTEWRETQAGKIVGVGMDVVRDASGYARVIRVYSGSPAAEAGITTAFYLMKIGGGDVKSLSLEQINQMLRGESGTTVEAVMRNRETGEEQTIVLQRRQYDAPSVYGMEAKNGIGYLKITNFNENTAQELRTEADKLLNSENAAKILVMDIRNNSGGALTDVLDTIDEVCPVGPIASSKQKNGEVKLLDTSDSKELSVPMIVLVNGATSGTAELFASSIRDFEKGIIVGTETAGKGTIQCDPIALSDGSAVSFTTGVLLTKKGDSFDGVGVKPDVEVLLTSDQEAAFYDLTLESDPQILKAFEASKQMLSGNAVVSNESEQPPPIEESTAQVDGNVGDIGAMPPTETQLDILPDEAQPEA